MSPVLKLESDYEEKRTGIWIRVSTLVNHSATLWNDVWKISVFGTIIVEIWT